MLGNCNNVFNAVILWFLGLFRYGNRIVPEEKYVFTQEAQSVVEDLQKLDVFVKTPKDALRVIEKIYGRETEWWNEPSRKKTINEFKKLYCKKDLLGIKWHAVLLKEAFTR